MFFRSSLVLLTLVWLTSSIGAEETRPVFNPDQDLLALHYDHAPDKDDGHSAAADRTVLETLYGVDWIKQHVLAVSGAYGKNAKTFNPKSDKVMDVCWNDCGGWLDAHRKHDEAVDTIYERWVKTIAAGGDVWVKEGGQSDITAEVVRRIQKEHPEIKTTERIHTVQHSNWNENQTTDVDLAYTKQQTHYIRIKDANRYLNVKGGNETFERAATGHAKYGECWKAAFGYYSPRERLDFSDTGELFAILGLGEIGIDAFRERFLE